MKRLTLLIMFMVLLLMSCELRKPVLPEWDVTLNIPLMNKSFFVSDLVDSVNIILAEDEMLTLRGSGSAQSNEFGNVVFNPQVDISNVPLISGIDNSIPVPIADSYNRVGLWYGLISSGVIRVRFQNMNENVDKVVLAIDDIITADGNVFEMHYSGVSDWESFPLDGCFIGDPNMESALEELNIRIMVKSSLPDGSYLGSLDLKLDDPIELSELHGYLRDYVLPVVDNVGSIEIEYPHNLENAIQLLEAKLKLELQNQIGFACEFIASIKAEKTSTGQSHVIPIVDENGKNLIISPASDAGPGTCEFIIEEGVSQLMQIMPDKVSLVDVQCIIRSDLMDGIGKVRASDKLFAQYQVDVPFKMILHPKHIKLQEPIEISLDKDNRRIIEDNVQDAELKFLVQNNIPIGFTLQLFFSSQAEIDCLNPATYLLSKSVNIHSKQWVENHPEAEDINLNREQLIKLSMDAEEMKIFSNPKLYMNLVFSFEDSGGPITITASVADFLQVKSMIKVGVHIKGGK